MGKDSKKKKSAATTLAIRNAPLTSTPIPPPRVPAMVDGKQTTTDSQSAVSTLEHIGEDSVDHGGETDTDMGGSALLDVTSKESLPESDNEEMEVDKDHKTDLGGEELTREEIKEVRRRREQDRQEARARGDLTPSPCKHCGLKDHWYQDSPEEKARKAKKVADKEAREKTEAQARKKKAAPTKPAAGKKRSRDEEEEGPTARKKQRHASPVSTFSEDGGV